MNTITTPARPQSLLTVIAQFLRNTVGSPTQAPRAANQPDLMQLYRLARGRDTVSPAIGALLAKNV